MNAFRARMLQAQISLLREWFRNDGGEGETVHAVCEGAEQLLRRVGVLENKLAAMARQEASSGG